jgi:ParB/RepB/Spo0J family partition protein
MKTKNIKVSLIDRNPLNPRQHFNQDDLASLGSSLKAGQLQPLKVRPAGDRFVLIDGERRWRAAQIVSIESLICSVEQMTDAETVLTMLALGRGGNVMPLSAIEEARGFRAALDLGATQQMLGERVGVSQAHVSQRLALLQLAPRVQEAVEIGALPLSTARLLIGIPDGHTCLEVVLKNDLYGGGAMPYAAARDYLAKEVSVNLKNAPFRTDDAALGPCACSVCHHRGENSDEYKSITRLKDSCFNPACYQAKLTAARQRIVEQEVAKGHVVLAPEQQAGIFSGDLVKPASGYVELSRPVDAKADVEKPPTWKELLGEKPVTVYVAFDEEGRARELASRDEAVAAIPDEEKSILDVPKKATKAEKSSRRSEEKAEAEAKRRDALARAKKDKACQEWLTALFGGLDASESSRYVLLSLLAEFGMAEMSPEQAEFLLPTLPDNIRVQIEADADTSDLAKMKKWYMQATTAEVLCLTVGCIIADRLRAGGENQAWVAEWHRCLVLREETPKDESAEAEDAAGDVSDLEAEAVDLAKACGYSLPGRDRACKFVCSGKSFAEIQGDRDMLVKFVESLKQAVHGKKLLAMEDAA